MDVDSVDGTPYGVRQLIKGPPSPLMATSLLGPHERALRSTHRFRLTGYSRLDFSGNSDHETDRGRKVGGTKEGGTKEGDTNEGGTKKGGMAPSFFCGVVSPAEFSAVGITDQCPGAIATDCIATGCRTTGPPLGFVELALVTRLITPFVNRIVAVFQNDL